MPLTKEQEEKLREEWYEYCGLDKLRGKSEGSRELMGVLIDLVPFWLVRMNKFLSTAEKEKNEALIAQRKEIVEGIKSALAGFDGYAVSSSEKHAESAQGGAEMFSDAILSLPQLTGKQEEDGTTT